ncbi:hypothetical protein HMF8227_02627 [Saliniradius amylolyticus]|uniref:DUF4382 domain-containing protein n=1 Tax=Saliniradius amylolyticus TaxID=2183582 RepID=A0A2S2E651_9ALTE|nr:DUF4382 domain-containing protein [Saliniradius amylolyticus]AWL13079.1 hypothetical protein HMF8227_02627 [Saliniradius amylolyticus]
MKKLVLVGLTGLLVACGGGSDSVDDSSGGTEPQPDTATFSLGVSDAPVDNASEVVVYFDGVELVPGEDADGDPIEFDVTDDNGDPRMIDLLTLQGQSFETIVSEEEIPAGTYGQLRLQVTSDSYIVMDQGTFPLQVPSNELKLDGFEAQAGVTAAFTVEFDLRKSLVKPGNNFDHIKLKPRGVRLVGNDSVGALEGTVAEALILDDSCSNKDDPMLGNVVYLYEGADLALSVLGDDADEPADAEEVSPFTTAEVSFDEEGQSYNYEVGFVPAGDYTVAFTCQAQLDEPESDENAEDGFEFLTSQTVTITAEETAEANFEAETSQ